MEVGGRAIIFLLVIVVNSDWHRANSLAGAYPIAETRDISQKIQFCWSHFQKGARWVRNYGR